MTKTLIDRIIEEVVDGAVPVGVPAYIQGALAERKRIKDMLQQNVLVAPTTKDLPTLTSDNIANALIHAITPSMNTEERDKAFALYESLAQIAHKRELSQLVVLGVVALFLKHNSMLEKMEALERNGADKVPPNQRH